MSNLYKSIKVRTGIMTIAAPRCDYQNQPHFPITRRQYSLQTFNYNASTAI